MNLILDSHSFLWFIMGSPRLSGNARALIEDEAHDKLISTASLWEMAIQLSLVRLTLAEPFGVLIPHQLRVSGIESLNIDLNHLATLTTLPFHHRDPFDRLIIAQAIVEQYPIVSVDPMFDAYPVERRMNPGYHRFQTVLVSTCGLLNTKAATSSMRQESPGGLSPLDSESTPRST